MDEVLGREHQESRKEPVTDAPSARTGREGVRGGRGAIGTLALNGVTRRFGDFTAVDDVSFEIKPGELLALVGASGSGKTTTLRIAAGYEVPDAGSVRLGGNDITRVPPERRGFGMVFQHYALFPHMPVEENVAFGLEARGVNRVDRLVEARAALASVGLNGAGNRAIQSLSGGEQQRVALARALVIEPQALLLDEPLSNLDPTLRQAMRDDLRAMLRRVGVPALFVTHDQEDAFAIADRIALLKKGRLLQCGTPEELYHAPVSREVAGFIGRGSIVRATDKGGGLAAVTIGGVTRELPVTRAAGAPPKLQNAFIVLRPDALEMSRSAGVLAWRGRVVNRRFAGGLIMYRVQLADDVTVEVESQSGDAREDDNVSVSPLKGPFPLVAE
jgi:iron(III) transport system ATP-binding protein